MVHAIPDILARIVERKRTELADLAPHRRELERRAAARSSPRDFVGQLTRNTPAIIAEIKQASPSKGLLCQDFEPRRIARGYYDGGAAALSVLTDHDFFQGSMQDLEAARHEVSLPVLRKDFTIDELHVIEAAAHGADAILLIAALLDTFQMRTLRELAESHQMAALVEVHDDVELDSALASGARIVGVNNRNLHTFKVTLETSVRLASKMPSGIVMVAESGIRSKADIEHLRAVGFHAFLVGEHLMTSADPAEALRELRS